jgi:membrane protein DedA with SNARE-associated domain
MVTDAEAIGAAHAERILMTAWITHLLQSYGYLAVFAFIGLESFGLPLPGESTLIAASVYAGSTHRLNIGVIVAVAAAAAVLGDNGGYLLGSVGGQRLVDRFGRYVRFDQRTLKALRFVFARQGGKVVFFGRFVTVLRTYAAFFAGMARMRWSRFMIFNAAGGIVWACTMGFGAFGLGSAATSAGQLLMVVGLILTVALTAVGMVGGRRWVARVEQLADADAGPGKSMASTGSGAAPQHASG